MARDAQQASDHALILRRVTELSLTPGMNIQDGFLTSHLERSFREPEADFGVYAHTDNGPMLQSKQLELFCVEHRKSWRMLQSKAGEPNVAYKAQQSLIKKVDAGDLAISELRSNGRALLMAEVEAAKA